MFNVFGKHNTRITWNKAVLWVAFLLALSTYAWAISGFTLLGTFNFLFALLWACTLGYQLANKPPKTKAWYPIDLYKSDI